MALVDAKQYARVRQLLPELLKFGIVGGIGTVVDLGGAALLHGAYHVEPLAAKAASTAAATVITYAGSRFWTFKDRENQDLKREAVLFIVLNLVGLLIAEIVVALVTYAMSLHGQLEYNIASFLGTGCGTIFRYFAYKKWVFLAPDEAAVAVTAMPAAQPVPDYPPWELDPNFLAPLTPAAEAPVAAPTAVTAPLHSPWAQQEPAAAWDPALAPTISWSVPAAQADPVPRTAHVPTMPQPAPVPTYDFSAPDFPAPDFPAPAYTTPPQEKRRPAPRSSGGGRHRKS